MDHDFSLLNERLGMDHCVSHELSYIITTLLKQLIIFPWFKNPKVKEN